MEWSVRGLLDFSYTPAINAAFKGTWAHSDPINNDDLDHSSQPFGGLLGPRND